MTVNERINKFNEENAPFCIQKNDNGKYTLHLPNNYIANISEGYCQAAFDAFAIEIRENPKECLFGSGYDWESVFQEAFKNDANIGRIEFDSECGGFYCNCDSLDIISDFGKRFKAMCEDIENFTPIVSRAMHNSAGSESQTQGGMSL